MQWKKKFRGSKSQQKSKLLKYKNKILKKDPKLQVVDTSDIKDYFIENHPKLAVAMEDYEILSNILSFAISTQVPELKPTFWQHLARNESFEMPFPHGSWYQNKDFIKYFEGSKVMAHVDHGGLHQSGYNFGPYIIFKLGTKGSTQMLCSVSNKANGCEWDRSKIKTDGDYGGHIELPPGTIYWMFDEGAFGGISHSIHNNESSHNLWSKRLFGGFTSKSYTLVMRPKLTPL